jgi:hypothetical protein
MIVRTHDNDDVLDADDSDQRPDDERENTVDVDWSGREPILGLEAFSQCVKRAGAYVAVDDAQREKSEFCETAAARTSFQVSTDLRDL